MASIANFFLMALLLLLAISKQALPRKSKSENVDVKQQESLLKSDLIPGDGRVVPVPVPPHVSGIPPEKSAYANIPSNTPYTGIPPKNSPLLSTHTPYTGSDKYVPSADHKLVTSFEFSAPIPKLPRLNVPSNTQYTGIPPKNSPQNNIPSYTPYAGIAPRKPEHPYTGIAPKESPHDKAYAPYAGIAPRKPPHRNIPPYTSYTSIAPRTPYLGIPSYTSYTGIASRTPHLSSDRYIPRKPPRLAIPSKSPYTGISPKKSPHSNIPSYAPYAGIAPRKPPRLTPPYTPYFRGEDDAREPDPGRYSSVPAADRP